MQTETLLLIVLAALLAFGVAFFQYLFKREKKGRLYIFLSALRALAIFGLLLLLINPKFVQKQYSLEKTNLALLLDNSSSLNATGGTEEIAQIAEQLKTNPDLPERFNFEAYSFGSDLNTNDTLSFNEGATNISQALATVEEIYAKSNTAIILVSDGNQTLGSNYEFSGQQMGFPIYSVVAGDTTTYKDLRIDQVNTNKYAFLRNKYPVEIYTSYQGSGEESSLLSVSVDGAVVFRERLQFNARQPSKVSNALIDANSVGNKDVKITLSPLDDERNKINNTRSVGVEVIDEKTNIVIVSSISHPDIGALKKAISSNEQRSVSIKQPGLPLSEFEETDLFILYQPTGSFRTIYEFLRERNVNNLTITGSKTDWDFLNEISRSFEKSSYGQTEEVFPVLNPGFSLFDVSDFDTSDFPPLETTLGDLLITRPYETIVGQQIKGVQLNEPLIGVWETDSGKEAVIFGENLWKWRVQSYRNQQNFENFDALVGKLVRYLATNEPKSRLVIDYEGTYQGANNARITASYFDEAFVFDRDASLTLKLKGEEQQGSREIPMLLKNGYYAADLSGLTAGNYTFTVEVGGQNISKSGAFRILDFDVEQQFFSSNYAKLRRLANSTDGKLYFPGQLDSLMNDLLEAGQFAPTQKSSENVVSLIDFRVLLGLIALALAVEWILRKYNGLI